jgi:hypothetical protein
MLKSALMALAAIMLLPSGALSGEIERDAPGSSAVKVRIVFDSQEAIVAMFDNPASRDFLTMLPLTTEFSDYARVEKVAYLPRKLDIQDTPTARETSGSDFTYYAPWGNLAVFYKGFGSDGQLYVLGRIKSGKGTLARVKSNFTARLEKVE